MGLTLMDRQVLKLLRELVIAANRAENAAARPGADPTHVGLLEREQMDAAKACEQALRERGWVSTTGKLDLTRT